MLGNETSQNIKGVSLISQGSKENQQNDHNQKKNSPNCYHCRKTGHANEVFWVLRGKHVDWKPLSINGKESRGKTTIF